MTWIKTNNSQSMTACGYEVIIEKHRSLHWATCYKLFPNGAKIKKFTFPPRKRIAELKLLVESNGIFSTELVTEARPRTIAGAETLAWWQK